MKELLTRIIVAAIGIPVAVFLIWKGGYYFMSIIAVVASIALWEFYSIQRKNNFHANYVSGLSAGLAIILSSLLSANILIAWIVILLLLSLSTMIYEMFKTNTHHSANISLTIAGVIYVSLSFTTLLLLREFYTFYSTLPFSANMSGSSLQALVSNLNCAWFVLSIFGSVWICDSAAYFTGKAIGKHKLFPRVSPKKTWEGALGGLIGAVGTFVLMVHWLIPALPLIHALIPGLIVGTIGQIGDLAESLIKRDTGVKDSSAILPGHGGLLDRFDSILFASPAIFIYLVITLWLKF